MSGDFVDLAVLEELRILDEGEGQVLKQLIDLFLKTTPGRLEAIRSAIHARDLKTLNAEAHSLKSSCANLGAEAMAGICQKLECAQDSEAAKEAPALMAALDELFVHVAAELKRVAAR